jgi:hypothetical protein
MWCRIKNFRRIANRYDELARNFASSITLAAVIIWWVHRVWTLACQDSSQSEAAGLISSGRQAAPR